MDPEHAITIINSANSYQMATAARRKNQNRPESPRGTNMLDEAFNMLVDRAKEEARQEGLQEGIEAAHTLWRQWLADYRNAQANGQPHSSPTPDGVDYAGLRPGRHSAKCQEKREHGNWPRTRQVPDYACATLMSDYYDARNDRPKPEARCPGCHERQPPSNPRHGRLCLCPCGARVLTFGNSLHYWLPLQHYAKHPELAADGGAPCTGSTH